MMFLTRWLSCSVTDSQPTSCPHRSVAPDSSSPQAASESVKVAFLPASRKAAGLTAALRVGAGGRMVTNSTKCGDREVALDAPAVTLGVFEGALHFFPQDFGEHGAANGARAWLGDVGCSITASEDSLKRLLDPVRFQREADGVAELYCGAGDRADRIGVVCRHKGRRGTMNGLKKRRGRPTAG